MRVRCACEESKPHRLILKPHHKNRTVRTIVVILTFLTTLLLSEGVFGQEKKIETLFFKEGNPESYRQTIEILIVRHLPIPRIDLNYPPLLAELTKRGYRVASEPLRGEVLAVCTASTLGIDLLLWCTNFRSRPEIVSILAFTPHMEHDSPESLLKEVHHYFQSIYKVQDI